MNSLPIPGHWNTCSMITEPPIRTGRRKPMSTTTGVSATRKPCSRLTRHSGRPFERAVLMKSLAQGIEHGGARIAHHAGGQHDRKHQGRHHQVRQPVPEASHSRAWKRPPTGNQPRFSAKIEMATRPKKNSGIETPSMPMTVSALSVVAAALQCAEDAEQAAEHGRKHQRHRGQFQRRRQARRQ